MGMATLCTPKKAPKYGHGDTLHCEKGPSLYLGMGTLYTAKRTPISVHGDTLQCQKDPYTWAWEHFAVLQRPLYMGMGLFFFDFLQDIVMDPPRRPGAAGGTVKPWPGGSRGLSGPRPLRHLEWLPAAAAPAGAVAAAGSRRVLSLRRLHIQSDANSKGQVRACNVRATCLHSVLHSVRRGKGQGRKGEVGRARSTRGPGDQRGPQGKSGEGERRERAGNAGKLAEGARVGQPRGGCVPKNVRAPCLHRVLYRAHGREGTRREAKGRKTHEGHATKKGSEGGYRGQRGDCRATCRASCAPCL